MGTFPEGMALPVPGQQITLSQDTRVGVGVDERGAAGAQFAGGVRIAIDNRPDVILTGGTINLETGAWHVSGYVNVLGSSVTVDGNATTGDFSYKVCFGEGPCPLSGSGNLNDAGDQEGSE